MRRRVYDSLNVLLACGIFTKERKKVTFNMDYYEFLPEQLKTMLDSSDDEAEPEEAETKKSKENQNNPDATLTEDVN